MNHLALFNGIGGFQLAAQWIGWNNTASVEIDPICNRITKYHFPNCKQYADIKKFDGKPYRGAIDIVSGGFPCQPYSHAGKRLGKEDDRHLWPEMLRVIREVAPTWVVGENVRGLISWNGGLVFDEVQADLEAEGYEVLPFLLPACAVNAPHRRDRIWFVAYTGSSGRLQHWERNAIFDGEQYGENENGKGQQQAGIGGSCIERAFTDTGLQRPQERQEPAMGADELCEKRVAADSQYDGQSAAKGGGSDGKDSEGSEKRQNGTQQSAGICEPEKLGGIRGNAPYTDGIGLRGQGDRLGNAGQFSEAVKKYDWTDFPTQPPVCSGNDGFPGELDGITLSKWRKESLKAYGNAIVPQVAYELFKVIEQMK